MKKNIVLNASELRDVLGILGKYAVDRNTYKLGIEIPKTSDDDIVLVSRSNTLFGTARLKPVSMEGSFAGNLGVSISYLTKIVGAIDGDTVSLTYDEDETVIKIVAGKSEFKLLTVKDDVMRSQFKKDEVVFSRNFTEDEYNHIIRLVSCAIDAKDESTPLLTAVAIKADGTNLNFYGAHRSMVARYQILDGSKPTEKPILLSPTFFKIKATADVSLSVTSNMSRIEFGSVAFESALIESKSNELPYDRAIEGTLGQNLKKTLFSVETFKRVMNRLEIYSATDKGDPVKVEYKVTDDQNPYLYLHTSNKEYGTFKENFDVIGMDSSLYGEKFALDVRKLRFATNIETDEVEMSYIGKDKQVVFSNNGNTRYLLIISPIRVPGDRWED